MEISVESIKGIDDKDFCTAYTVYVEDHRVLTISTYMVTTASKWISDVMKSNRSNRGNIVVGVSVDRESLDSVKGGYHNSRYDLLEICVAGSHCLLFHLPEPYQCNSSVKFLDDFFNDPRVVAVGMNMLKVAENLEKNHGISVMNPVDLQSFAVRGLKRDDLDLARYDLDRLTTVVLGKHMDVVRPEKRVEWFARPTSYPYIWYKRNLCCEKVKYATVDVYLCFLIGTKLIDMVYCGGGASAAKDKKKKKNTNKIKKK